MQTWPDRPAAQPGLDVLGQHLNSVGKTQRSHLSSMFKSERQMLGILLRPQHSQDSRSGDGQVGKSGEQVFTGNA